MKKAIPCLAILVFALAAVFTVRASLRAANGAPRIRMEAPQPVAAAAPTPAEPHPEIREALGALQNARQHLAHGAHDFGGHRANALRLTNQAIQECREAMRYDRR
jgi:hypothetical protein